MTLAVLSRAEILETPDARGDGALRRVPVRWRILAIAVLNTLAVLVLAFFVWESARNLTAAWSDLTQARTADRLLVTIRSDTGRVQSLIHRYFTQPTSDVLIEISWRRDDLGSRLAEIMSAESALTPDLTELSRRTQLFFSGFDDLKAARLGLVRTYEQEVLKPAREMAGLYGIIDSATSNSASFIWPALGKSREAYSTAVVAANSFYLSQELKAAADARDSLAVIERTVPFMLDLAENDLQRSALKALHARAVAFEAGFNRLTTAFTAQNDLLRSAIDDNQAAMTAAVDRLSRAIRATEEAAQGRFDGALDAVFTRTAVAGLGFMAVSILLGLGTARSVSKPLEELQLTMRDVADGDYQRKVPGTRAPDEIGEMARSVEVLRKNGILRRRAEEDLRAAKERAETTLNELRDAQANLIEAEKFAALGALVAGVAHEVNNPVGISLTVASSLARRCEEFAGEMQSGSLRKSRLLDFVQGNQDAANQLVANLQRAGELVQSFKQVAVDRSHAERRVFDLRESTDQIAASLRPGARKRQVAFQLEVPDGIVLDSYPGPYGQVITNLFLNAVTHAFARSQGGTVRLTARQAGAAQVEVLFADDGDGMPEEVLRRAFEPFFTTRRNDGGTGLGLHIVYNLVTRRLGGRISVTSAPGQGTQFRIVLPLVAPDEQPDTARMETSRA